MSPLFFGVFFVLLAKKNNRKRMEKKPDEITNVLRPLVRIKFPIIIIIIIIIIMEDTTTFGHHQHTYTTMNNEEEEEEEEEEEQQPLLRGVQGERRKRRLRKSNDDDSTTTTNGRLIKNHPPGLLVVSLVEIWERFGYYTARAVLVLFARDEIFASKENIKNVWFAQWFARIHGMMDVDGGGGGGGDFSSKQQRMMEREALSSKLYGTYTALAYLTPMFGGFVADFTSKHSMISTGIGLISVRYQCRRIKRIFI